MTVAHAAALRPHDHAAWFGDGAAALYPLAVAALSEGVRRNEKLMFVADDPQPELLSGIGDIGRLLADRQLELFDVEAVYGATRNFSASAQLAMFGETLTDALAAGYTGIRVVADNTPLTQGGDESFQRWLDWEQMTDHFQAVSPVTGVCFFDSSAISPQRQADLAALHPIRSATTLEPPVSLFVDGDAIFLVGSLNAVPPEQLRRLLATIDFDRRPLLDLSAADLGAGDALDVLAEFATANRPLRIRGNAHLRGLVAHQGPAGAHLHVDEQTGPAIRCARCGDVIGAYEPTTVLVDGRPCASSPLAQPASRSTPSVRYHQGCYEA